MKKLLVAAVAVVLVTDKEIRALCVPVVGIVGILIDVKK